MKKPVMNLDEVTFDDIEDNGRYTSRRGQISDHIGASETPPRHRPAGR
ncbi:MAG TPA: hypothetical protein VGF31_07645 [Myxococcaceae bacterium]|jgi:hypothetical protein